MPQQPKVLTMQPRIDIGIDPYDVVRIPEMASVRSEYMGPPASSAVDAGAASSAAPAASPLDMAFSHIDRLHDSREFLQESLRLERERNAGLNRNFSKVVITLLVAAATSAALMYIICQQTRQIFDLRREMDKYRPSKAAPVSSPSFSRPQAPVARLSTHVPPPARPVE